MLTPHFPIATFPTGCFALFWH